MRSSSSAHATSIARSALCSRIAALGRRVVVAPAPPSRSLARHPSFVFASRVSLDASRWNLFVWTYPDVPEPRALARPTPLCIARRRRVPREPIANRGDVPRSVDLWANS